jgi:cardiolipin synthase
MKLLISAHFWADLYNRLDSCENEVRMQFMTFEGDETGLKLANKLIELSKKGIKVKLIVDSFTDYFVSDILWTKPEVKEEVLATKKMMVDMVEAGIELKRTRPFGLFWMNFFARNHKKIIVIDDYAYLGGINISDHNKEWFDFMIGIDKKKSIESILKDFEFTFSGKEVNSSENEIYTTKKLKEKYFDLIKNAKEEIIISSPYVLDRSLLKVLETKKALRKKVYTLKQSNIGILNTVSPYLLKKIPETNTDIYFFKQFSHSKFLLIDRKYLLVGSSNFNEHSFYLLQEIGFVIDDKEFIDDFYKRVIEGSEFEKSKDAKSNLLSYLINHMTSSFLWLNSKIICPKVLK